MKKLIKEKTWTEDQKTCFNKLTSKKIILFGQEDEFIKKGKKIKNLSKNSIFFEEIVKFYF
jgi:hypothetical protein